MICGWDKIDHPLLFVVLTANAIFLTKGANMSRRAHEFQEADKIRVMLWCARHCCLCGKFAGVGMEVAHLDKKRSDIENAIPLCFDCHAMIGHYNKDHPRGRKYTNDELKARRDQIYELYTRPLVPPIEYNLSQEDPLTGKSRELPDVGFSIINLGTTYPVKARVIITICKGENIIGPPKTQGHYNGKYLMNLNPQFGFRGHFKLPDAAMRDKEQPIVAKIETTIIDIYEREHMMLSGGFIMDFNTSTSDWYFEPSIDDIFPIDK